MSSISSLSLNSLFRNSFSLTPTHPSDHSHFCLMEYHLIFFPYRPSLTSMQHTTVAGGPRIPFC